MGGTTSRWRGMSLKEGEIEARLKPFIKKVKVELPHFGFSGEPSGKN